MTFVSNTSKGYIYTIQLILFIAGYKWEVFIIYYTIDFIFFYIGKCFFLLWLSLHLSLQVGINLIQKLFVNGCKRGWKSKERICYVDIDKCRRPTARC